MKSDVIKTLEKIIKIPFVDEHFEKGSICFARDENLRPDFILQFTTQDIINYVYGIIWKLYTQENKELESISQLKIPFPTNTTFFWEQSIIGQQKRIKKPIEELESHVIWNLKWSN